MSDIPKLIEMLQSNNSNKRYDACEQLRVSQQALPQDAIDALNFATSDSNPDVADAALRALALHVEMKKEPMLRNTDNNSQISNNLTNNLLLVSIWTGILGWILVLLSWTTGTFILSALACISWITAIITGYTRLQQLKAKGEQKEFPMSGIIMSGVGCLVVLFYFLFIAYIMFSVISQG